MADNLMENWSETKTPLTDGLTGTKKQVMESVLENTKTYPRGRVRWCNQAGNIATLTR